MRVSTPFVILVLSLTATANPEPTTASRPSTYTSGVQRSGCIQTSQLKTIVDRWINFFVKPDKATINEYIADGFISYSDSVNTLDPKGPRPVSKPNFASKQAFVTGQLAETANNTAKPPESVFNVIAMDHGCDSFTFRWSWRHPGDDTCDPDPISQTAGIDFVFLKPGTYQYMKAYSEYNNLGFAYEYKGLGPCINQKSSS